LTDEALDGTLCSTCLGRSYCPVVRQTAERMNLNPKLVENFNTQEQNNDLYVHSFDMHIYNCKVY